MTHTHTDTAFYSLGFTIGFEVQAVEPNKYVICSTDDHIVEQNYTFMEKE